MTLNSRRSEGELVTSVPGTDSAPLTPVLANVQVPGLVHVAELDNWKYDGPIWYSKERSAGFWKRGDDSTLGVTDYTHDLNAMHKAEAAVTNEVGLGIVPGDAMSRKFRDMAGRLNSMVAAEADEVFLSVSGIAIKIKGS